MDDMKNGSLMRAEILELRARLERTEQAARAKDEHAMMVTQYICGIMHKQGWDDYALNAEDMARAFEHSRFRLRVNWRDNEDGDTRTAMLCLVKVTDEERVEMDAAKAENERALEDAQAREDAAEAGVLDLAAALDVDVTVVREWTPMQRAQADKWLQSKPLDNNTAPIHVRAHLED